MWSSHFYPLMLKSPQCWANQKCNDVQYLTNENEPYIMILTFNLIIFSRQLIGKCEAVIFILQCWRVLSAQPIRSVEMFCVGGTGHDGSDCGCSTICRMKGIVNNSCIPDKNFHNWLGQGKVVLYMWACKTLWGHFLTVLCQFWCHFKPKSIRLLSFQAKHGKANVWQ